MFERTVFAVYLDAEDGYVPGDCGKPGFRDVRPVLVRAEFYLQVAV
jgi:hypothetical protein